MTSRVRRWLSAMLRRSRFERDMADELRAHLDLRVDALVASGLAPDEARRQARIEFGSVEAYKDRMRHARRLSWLDDLRQDLRHAVRSFERSPGFTGVTGLTLALGIGAVTAIFGIVDAVIVRPLPYKDSDRLVHIVSHLIEGDTPVRHLSMYQRFFVGLREHAQTLSAVGGYDSFSTVTRRRLAMLVEGDQGAAEWLGTRMSPALFRMLGTEPALGRVFRESEERPGGNDVMVLSSRVWRSHYGSDASVLGRSLTLGSRLYTVIGIMPEEFQFPDRQTDFWIPLTPADPPPPSAPRSDAPESGYADAVFAKLQEGVSPQAAAAEVESILRGLDREIAAERQRPVAHTSLSRRAEIVSMQEELVAPVRPALRMFPFVAWLVLLIACANVANLLLARATSRQREIAIRAAIGAGRGRLMRHLLTEGLVLALVGGCVGIVLAMSATHVITTIAPTEIPRLGEVELNLRVLVYALAVSSLTGVAVGLVVAVRVAGTHQIGSLTLDNSGRAPSESRFRFGFRNVSVIAEIAMAMVLLIAAGLLIRSFVALVNVNPGYDARNVLTFRVVLPPGDSIDTHGLYDQLLMRLESLPLVEAAGATDVLPIAGTSAFHFPLAGLPVTPGPADAMVMRVVSRDYFRVMGIRLIEGRSFSRRDDASGAQPILVNREFARRFLRGERLVGTIVGQSPMTYEVIGVVDDVRHAGLDADVQPEYYVDLRHFALTDAISPSLVIRSQEDPATLALTIRSVVRDIDPRVGVDLNVATMSDIVAESVARPRFNTVVLAAFAAIALALAATGIYSVVAFSVAQRTREIGIRMALGALRSDVMGLVLRQTALMTAAGILFGVAGAAAVTRSLAGLLFGVTPLDPATFIVVSLVFAMLALLASYVPARRATKVDPLVALRYE